MFFGELSALEQRCMFSRASLAVALLLAFPALSRPFLLAQSQPLAPVAAANTAPAKPPASAAAAGTADPDLSKESTFIEQFATVLRYAADGTAEQTITARVKIQSEAGVRAFGVLSFPYAQQVDRMEIRYIRVLKPDGTAVETSASDAQDMPEEVTRQAPFYSDLRQKQVPVRSLSVGDTLEYQIRTVMFKALTPGQFWYAQNFLEGQPVREETVELRVPKDKYVQVASPTLQPSISEEGAERVYRWKRSHAEPTSATKKDKAPPKLDWSPSIAVSTFRTWGEVGEWYRGLAADRAVPNAAVKSKADEVTRGLTTDDAKIAAIYDFVSTQFRYIGVSFGVGRYQPHTADQVLTNQFGDCKDKHTLLAAMLKAEGYEAWPVLVNSGARLSANFPTPGQFDHVITLVPRGKEQMWLDSTPEVAPEQLLMSNLRDKQVLVIPTDAAPHLERTPANPPFASFVDWQMKGKLDREGTLTAHFDVSMRGDAEVISRAVFRQVPRPQWQELMQNISQSLGFAGDVSDVDASLPEKTREPFHYDYDYERRDFGDWKGRRFQSPIPAINFPSFAEDTALSEPVDLGELTTDRYTARITLPAGYKAELPEHIARTSSFAEYDATYELQDRDLLVHRTLRIKANTVPASARSEYKAFTQAVNDDAETYVQLVGEGVTTPARAAQSNAAAAELVQEASRALEGKTQLDFAGAKSALDAAQKLNPREPGLWSLYGYLYQLQRRPDDSIAAYQKELALQPEAFDVYRYLAGVQMQAKHFDDAEKTLRGWMAADPQNSTSSLMLAGMLMMQARYAQAIPILQDTVASAPKPELVKLQLGTAQIRSGDKYAGGATLEGLIASSQDEEIWNDAAYELADSGIDYPVAGKAAERAVSSEEQKTQTVTLAAVENADLRRVSQLAAAWDTVGWIDYHEGRIDDAESYILASWMLEQGEEVGEHLGEVYEKEGKKGEALHAYRLALAANSAADRTPGQQPVHDRITARMAALKAAGVKEPVARASDHPWIGGDELGLLRSVEVPLPIKSYASAEFFVLMTRNGVQDASFIRGDDALKAAGSPLKAAKFDTPFPKGSTARIVRRGILSCSDGSDGCRFVLLLPQFAHK